MATLGTTASITTSRTKIYDILVPSGEVYVPEAIYFSAETADVDWEVYVDKDVNALPAMLFPTVTLTPATTGGTIPASKDVFVRVTSVDITGESLPTYGNKKATTGAGTSTNKVGVSWSSVAGATSYNVYAGNKPGNEAFFGDTTGTSLDITELPADDPFGVPVYPDLFFFTVLGKPDSIPLTAMKIRRRLQIFVTASAGTKVSVSIPLK